MTPPTVLIADDDRSIRTVLTQALGRSGYQVRSTGNAATLWRWVEDGEGDLVITDVVMPDENGLDLIPRIRKIRPDLRVVVMSAQLNIRPVAPRGVSVSAGGACTDAVPALEGVALPETVTTGIWVALPAARAALWPLSGRLAAVMPVDRAVPIPVTCVNVGTVVPVGTVNGAARVVRVTVAAVPIVSVAGALSTAATLIAGRLTAPPARVHA